MSYRQVFKYLVLVMVLSGCHRETEFDLQGKLVLSDQDNIYLFDVAADLNNGKKLFSAEGSDVLYEPAVSSDGAYLCFTRYHRSPKDGSTYDFLRMDITGGDIDTLVSKIRRGVRYPTFSPDNRRIAFLILGKEKEVKGRFFTVLGPPTTSCAILDLETRMYRVITDSYLSPCRPGWSPDGSSLWVSTYEGSIVRIDLNGRELETFGQGYCPSLSPDGEHIAYLDKGSLFVADLSGKSKRKLASKYSYYAPQLYAVASVTWSPDSQFLLYQATKLSQRITTWSSDYVIVPATGRGPSRHLFSVSAAGFGACWIP